MWYPVGLLIGVRAIKESKHVKVHIRWKEQSKYEAQICSVIAYVYGGRYPFIAATGQYWTANMPES
jgi:hypothetical protein